MMQTDLRRLFVVTVTFIVISGPVQSQEGGSSKSYHFDGSVEVTNNGFSFVPTFNLGKPATIININAGNDRFTFEPQFRFDLEGMRPWSIIGFWRYKVVNRDKLMIRVSTQFPALAFSYETAEAGNVMYEKILAQRFLPFDVTLNYSASDYVSLGTFALYGRGLEKADQLDHSLFWSFYAVMKDIPFGESIRFRWHPQLYYLNIDRTDGLYTAHTVSLSHTKFPVSLASMCNIEVSSDIDTKDFTWNIGLIYTFSNALVRK